MIEKYLTLTIFMILPLQSISQDSLTVIETKTLRKAAILIHERAKCLEESKDKDEIIRNKDSEINIMLLNKKDYQMIIELKDKQLLLADSSIQNKSYIILEKDKIIKRHKIKGYILKGLILVALLI